MLSRYAKEYFAARAIDRISDLDIENYREWRKTYFTRGPGSAYVATTVLKGLEEMTTGTVKWFNSVKGYGFIQPEDGSSDAFVHISAVESAGLDGLREGQKIQYELVPGRDGKSAAENLVALD